MLAALRDRFQIREHLGWYDDVELCEIVRRNSVKLEVHVDDGRAWSLLAVEARRDWQTTVCFGFATMPEQSEWKSECICCNSGAGHDWD